MRILVATRNAGKVRELRRMLQAIEGLELVGVDPELPDVVEDGDTFEANAEKKAREYSAMTGLPTLADDSGLVVDALGGAPGIHSARFGGVQGDDAANNRTLLERLDGVADERRTARFVCALAFCDGTDVVVERGEVEGRILHAPRGEGGFGYDPLFYVEEHGATTAEISAELKNAISHRGAAVKKMAPRLAAWARSHPR